MRSVKRLCFVAAALAVVLAVVLAASQVEAKIAHHETFDSLDSWVTSGHKPDYGAVARSAGNVYVDEKKETGLQLTQDARFYAVSKKLPTQVENDKKDFVVSFSVKSEQSMSCGGAYIKLLSEVDQKDFNGDSEYWLMFGPDKCGSTNRIHIIFNYHGKNLLWNKKVPFPDDKVTHVYTLHVTPAHEYTLYIDGKESSKGKLEDDWNFLEPKMIPDPSDVKPDDWVDAARIPDPTDKKPEDWDDEPAVIEDTSATKPEDWDDEEDGEWVAPEIPNPKYKGKWSPRTIENPDYKGPWKQKQMPNPAYTEDADLHKIPKPLKYVGIDVWQVESGSIFNNIIIGDDIKEVLEVVKSTYGAMADAEREARAKLDAQKAADDTPEADAVGSTDEDVDDEEEDL